MTVAGSNKAHQQQVHHFHLQRERNQRHVKYSNEHHSKRKKKKYGQQERSRETKSLSPPPPYPGTPKTPDKRHDVHEEVRNINKKHDKILGELNLDVEAMIAPKVTRDGVDDMSVGPTDELLSPECHYQQRTQNSKQSMMTKLMSRMHRSSSVGPPGVDDHCCRSGMCYANVSGYCAVNYDVPAKKHVNLWPTSQASSPSMKRRNQEPAKPMAR